MIRLKSARDIVVLRTSGRILAALLSELQTRAGIGVTLESLDRVARSFLVEHGARPAFLGYRPAATSEPYPAAICTSVNDVVVHGIPSAYALKNGDVLKIDAGVDYNGYFTDSAVTVLIGKPRSQKIISLLETTKHALEEAIAVARAGNTVGDIGYAVQKTVAAGGFSVIRGLTGHGVGFAVHEEPSIENRGTKGKGLVLESGLVIAIEPMVSITSPRVIQKDDGSFVTADGSIAAHFEHTIAITKEGCEVLTQ